MSITPIDKPMKHLERFTIVVTLVVLTLAPSAYGKITSNTIDPFAALTEQGRHIIATGPIECTAGQKAYLRVTVTQRTTGARAEGRTRIICEGIGTRQQWEVHASTLGKKSFEVGDAIAVALARTTKRGNTDDAHQWLVPITLVEE